MKVFITNTGLTIKPETDFEKSILRSAANNFQVLDIESNGGLTLNTLPHKITSGSDYED